MKPSDFLHPDDAAALRQMENVPGFASLIKKVLSIGVETLQYGVNMASNIRLSRKQLPQIYSLLPPICERMGISEPELYLQMNPVPNAWTMGDTRIFITLTSSLIEMMSEEELKAIIAHECGHILCRHVLYHTVARWLQSGVASLGLLGGIAAPVEYAMLYWSRKSELSADRAASIITSPDIVASTMARLAGGPKSITSQLNMHEWAKQADEYELIQNSGVWNMALQLSVVAGLDHPFAAIRVMEILKWGKSEQFRMIKEGKFLLDAPDGKCPSCNSAIDKNWKFCRNCGHKL